MLPQMHEEELSRAYREAALLLSRFARQHVTVALGGDGGDELFAGYSTIQAHRLAAYYNRLPKLLRQRFMPGHQTMAPVRQRSVTNALATPFQ